MATKKTAPKATKAEKTEKAVKPVKAAAAKPAAKPAVKPAAKPAPKAPVKAAAKAVAKPAVKPAAKALPAAKAAGKSPVKAAPKAEPKAAKAPAPVEAKPPRAARTAAPQAPPLLPEVVAAPPPAPAPRPAPKAKKAAGPAGLDAHAATILEAIESGRAVELIFLDENANPPRTFEPRQLIFDVFTQAWFAWGWDRRYNAERHHCLDQMAEINPVDGPGRAAQGPYKDGTPANQIGGWLGGEAIPVKAVLMKQWIFAVKQAPAPFPDFHMEDAPDGKATVSFTATDLRAISRWCMQFGDGIQVLEPQRLIDRIKQVGVAWGGKPVQGAPAPKAATVAAPAAAPASAPSHRGDRDRDRDRGGHRRDRGEHRGEHRDEPRHTSEHRPEHRDEPKRDEPKRDEPRREEYRRERESQKEETKGKPAKVEVRVERL